VNAGDNITGYLYTRDRVGFNAYFEILKKIIIPEGFELKDFPELNPLNITFKVKKVLRKEEELYDSLPCSYSDPDLIWNNV
jgi:hypothetical protein